ncbi:MAG: diacylglycerol kinase family lipid kinase [Gordonibacter sp.]|uniref:diacylglycerol/lipid kinase family protein n=1 Tax=Gordonibacter sp. TaxID=1968902 RepID=UPI002FC6661A
MAIHEGRTLLIANPAAQNGNGAAAAARAAETLRASMGDEHFSLVLTESGRQAIGLASQAGDFDTVLALGGDGIVHEVANGLMMLSGEDRPVLGVIPVGSGNDYARTLGISATLDRAVQQVLEGRPRAMDVGRCNGEHFVETLSFGLDAAIALDTVERRKRSRLTGTLLYAASGLDQLLHHLVEYRFEARFDGDEPVQGSMFLFAVQIGPTYGSGFRICPDAQPDDGLFDLCIARPPLSVLRATYIFLMAKSGWHTRFQQVEFLRVSSLDVRFDCPLAAQVDGELIVGDRFLIEIVPHALRVLTPAW